MTKNSVADGDIPAAYDHEADGHSGSYTYAANLRENIELIFAVLDGEAVLGEVRTLDRVVADTRFGIDGWAPWLVQQGYILRVRPYDLDPIGYLLDWHQFLSRLLPFLGADLSPAGISILAAGQTRH